MNLSLKRVSVPVCLALLAHAPVWTPQALGTRTSAAVLEVTDPPTPLPGDASWMDLFEWLLCKLYELLGGDCNDLDALEGAEERMTVLSVAYAALGGAFQPPDPAQAREWIEELHGMTTDRLSELDMTVATTFLVTLEFIYEDAGGDPNDL